MGTNRSAVSRARKTRAAERQKGTPNGTTKATKMVESHLSLHTWFKREILSHEEILMRFLSRVWPRRDEVPDIRQESYARVYEAAQKSRPQAPKAFLFATAKHLMADRLRRERIVSIQAGGENEYLNVLIDEISPEQRVGANQELVRLARAFDRLSPKCRGIIWLRRVKE